MVTRTASKYCNLVPLELVGWLMRRLEIKENRWILLVTDDNDCEVVAQLIMWAP